MFSLLVVISLHQQFACPITVSGAICRIASYESLRGVGSKSFKKSIDALDTAAVKGSCAQVGLSRVEEYCLTRAVGDDYDLRAIVEVGTEIKRITLEEATKLADLSFARDAEKIGKLVVDIGDGRGDDDGARCRAELPG